MVRLILPHSHVARDEWCEAFSAYTRGSQAVLCLGLVSAVTRSAHGPAGRTTIPRLGVRSMQTRHLFADWSMLDVETTAGTETGEGGAGSKGDVWRVLNRHTKAEGREMQPTL